jgi:hypothetical protein
MKTILPEKEQFILDASGQPIGVVLDVAAYERLLEAAEDNADIHAYRAAKTRVSGELRRGEFATLEDYRAKRARKRK